MQGLTELVDGKLAIKRSYFDTMRSVVADENLVLVIGNDTIGKLEVAGAAELVQHGAVAIEHNHTHYLHRRPRSHSHLTT